MSWNSARLRAPSLSASRCAKMAARRSSVKLSSSLEVASGSFCSHARKASRFALFPPALACLKTSSWPSFFSTMCSRRISTSRCMLETTRNSSEPSSTMGAQASVAFFRSSSMAAMASAASSRIFLATYFCSWVTATFLCFDISSTASFMRFWSASSCSLKAAAPWFSFCLAARKARASSSLVWVAWETSISFLQAASASSAASWSETSARKGCTASAILFSSASAASSFSPASCIWAVFFRPAVSFRNCVSLAVKEPMLWVSVANSSAAGLLAARS
mmetsp:Transcript_54009/g.158929  ORF Transcript_54009/g.158929 Transcript_54009/m.158929 type:complete len:277 (-) Transcript_54009:2992-3822(-)